MSSRIKRIAAAAAGLLVALTVAPAAQAQTDEATYVAEIEALASEVTNLATESQAANASWESRETGFNDTLSTLEDIQQRARGVVDALAALSPPADYIPAHAEMEAQAGALSSAATGMIEGLVSSDDGSTRRNARDEFSAAAGAFIATASTVTSVPVTTTTTSTTVAPTSTTTSTSTTSTTLAPVTTTTAAIQPVGGSDNSWPVAIGALLVGMALGAAGGLLLGRQARLKLLTALRSARSSPPPG